MSDGLLSVDEALERLLAGARPVAETETVATIAATGRVLAKPQASTLDVPPLDNTSMDGYAVRSAECASGAARLRVAQLIPAGAGRRGAAGADRGRRRSRRRQARAAARRVDPSRRRGHPHGRDHPRAGH